MRLLKKLVLLLCLVLLTVCRPAASAPVDASYECLWWSVAQMRDLDPNRPPEKTTHTPISRWEYSDPIGVPHPETVTLLVTLPSADADKLVVKTRWLSKTWSSAVKRPVATSTSDNGMQRMRFDIAVGSYINTYRPKLLRSTIYVAGSRIKDLDLPIQLGD